MGGQPPKNVHVDTKKLAPRDATGGAGPHLQIPSLLVLFGCSAMSDTAQAPRSTDKGPLRGVGQTPLGEDSGARGYRSEEHRLCRAGCRKATCEEPPNPDAAERSCPWEQRWHH